MGKPVLLTVDDDPSVSRAVARDLRRRYGEDYRVMRAACGPPAVEIKVVGHRFSPESFEVRDFLARNLVPYRWYAADDPEGRRLLDAAGHGPESIPLIPGIR